MSYSKRDQETIAKLAIAIIQVIQLHIKRPEIAIAMDLQMEAESEDFDFQYAEALFNWRSEGKPQPAYFSTASPILLALHKEMQKEFGLEIVDPKTGINREKNRPTFRKVVDGFGYGYKATKQELSDQYKRDMSYLKKNKIPLLN